MSDDLDLEVFALYVEADLALDDAEYQLLRAAREGRTDLHDLGARVREWFLVKRQRWAALEDRGYVDE
jgi:hypothetical protein